MQSKWPRKPIHTLSTDSTFLSHTHAHTLSHFLSFTHTHTHTLSLSHTFSLSLSHHTHTHTHTTHTHTLSLSHFLSHHTHTHTPSLTLSLGSVSSALDEAANALTRMKSERGSYEAFLRGAHQPPPPPSPPLTTTPSPSSAPRPSGDGGTSAPQVSAGTDDGGRAGKMAAASTWAPPHDLPAQGLPEGGVANEVGVVRGGASQGESIQTMHRLLTQGLCEL